MRIAIISDTHGNVANFKKAANWINKEKIQTILHCGDIGDLESLKESLADFKGEFFGVFGNMDKDFKTEIKEYDKIPGVQIKPDIFETEIDKKKVAFTHFPATAKKLAQSQKFDLVFYGHTHRPWEEKIGNCRMINPGELAGQFYKPAFAVYDIATDLLELKILEKCV
jgi:hypothetical protein